MLWFISMINNAQTYFDTPKCNQRAIDRRTIKNIADLVDIPIDKEYMSD
jgi:hypothetical protein